MEIPPPTYQKFDSMFTIGDSNAMGFGLNGYYGDPLYADDHSSANNYTDFTYLHGTNGSFPQLVQEGLNIDRSAHNTMTYPGERSKDALYFLGGNVSMENDAYYPMAMSMWMNGLLLDSTDKVDTQETYQLWRDWMYNPDTVLESDPLSDIEKGDVFINQLSTGGNKLVLMYSGISDVFFSSVQQVLRDPEFSMDNIGNMALKLVDLLWNNYFSFLDMVPALIEQVQALNGDTTLVIVGAFNPVKDLKISDSIELPIFNAMGVITGLMNEHYKEWAEKYGAIYVDISNVETPTLEEGYSVSFLFGENPEPVYHATPEGHKYIARQILKALEVEKTVTTDIVVDLGSVSKIDAVNLDGNIVRDYSFDPETHTLTVPCSHSGAKLLTVTEERENGTYLATYQLAYEDDGYVAYRLYATRSLQETVFKVVNSFWSILKPIFDTFFSFFRK